MFVKKGDFMKKIILVLMFIMMLASCDAFNEKCILLDNGLFIYYNEKEKTAIASSFDIPSLDTECEFIIPDKYNECVISTFGYVSNNSKHPRSSFNIKITDSKFVCKETYDSMTIKPYSVTINLNQYINKIYEIDCEGYWYIEGEDVCYKIECYFIIPENNETFYSDNGNVYYKSNDSLVYKRWSLE